MKQLSVYGVVTWAALAAGCSGPPVNDYDYGVPRPYTVDVDLAERHQRIDGFGASSAWYAPNITEEQADAFYSVDSGLGLSLLRIQIRPTGVTAELETARKAAARGVKVWAAPWSPPGEWKSNGTTRNGGRLLPEYRQAWADRLTAFAQSMAAEGVPLIGLSAQNEPGYVASWETCEFTDQELVTFVRDFLGPALAQSGTGVPVIAPESQSWTLFPYFADALLADPAAAAYVGPLATHRYAGAPTRIDGAEAAGKVVWQTEISDDDGQTVDIGIDSALRTARMIQDDLVAGEVSAWHYWWLIPGPDSGNSALMQDGELTRRAWALANWSRFVRPGWVRVGSRVLPQPRVATSAFVDPATGGFALVVMNENDQDKEQDFKLVGGRLTAVTPWVTSAELALASQPAVAVANGGFTTTLRARSVTTFVGTATLD